MQPLLAAEQQGREWHGYKKNFNNKSCALGNWSKIFLHLTLESILLFLWIYFLKDYVLQSVLWLYNCITIVIQTKDSSKTHVKETETEERIILDNKVTSSAVFSSFTCNLASSLILWSSQELFAKIGNHNTGWNKITLRSFRTWRIIFPDSNHLASDIVHRTNDRENWSAEKWYSLLYCKTRWCWQCSVHLRTIRISFTFRFSQNQHIYIRIMVYCSQKEF